MPPRMSIGKRPLIVGCISSERTFRRCARSAPRDCDVVEVRLDLTGLCGGQWLDLCAAVQKRGRPVLLTIRDADEGGASRFPEAERLGLYLQALDVVWAVDMEIRAHALLTLAPVARKRRVKVLASFHDFQKTPPLVTLRKIENRGRSMGADVVKIATTVRSPSDAARLFAMPALAQGPICVLGMGERGAVSRIALPCAGSCLAYGALHEATAPGQPTCRQLAAELHRWGVRPNPPRPHSP